MTGAFRVLRGAPQSPVILHVPHGSRRIPGAARRRIALGDAALELELDRLTDGRTGLIAARAAELSGCAPWIFENLVSRLVVDPERFPDEREEMRAVGMGAVYTRTSHGEVLREDDETHAGELLATYFRPYAQAMSDLADERLAAAGRAVIIDVHSYPSVALPYELHAEGERPAVCLGTDTFHTPPWLLDSARLAFERCGDVRMNTPFAGCYVPLRHYGADPTVGALMVEIRRDVYQVEPYGELTGGFAVVAQALAGLVKAASQLS
jgi:N-formylglutamate deformylase